MISVSAAGKVVDRDAERLRVDIPPSVTQKVGRTAIHDVFN
jgi:hypothetical protein